MSSNYQIVTLDEFITNAPRGAVYTSENGTKIYYRNGKYLYKQDGEVSPLWGAWRMLHFDHNMYNKHKQLLDSYDYRFDPDEVNNGRVRFCVNQFSRLRRP